MSSIASTKPAKDKSAKPKKVYYSARGGARSKGADNLARTHASPPPSTALETPLPRDTSSHYLRGGMGNEWNYVVEEGVFERALAHDQLRLQELHWHEFNHRVSGTGLRGGARIPKKKDPKDPKAKKPKLKGIALFRNRAGSISSETKGTLPSPTSPNDLSLSSFPTRDFAEKSLEQRLYELSIASTDDAGSIAFSNFTAPTFLLANDDSTSEHSSSEESVVTIGGRRIRSLSMSSVDTENSLSTPEISPVHPHGGYTLVSSGIFVFKPEAAQPLTFDEPEGSELSLGPSAIAL